MKLMPLSLVDVRSPIVPKENIKLKAFSFSLQDATMGWL